MGLFEKKKTSADYLKEIAQAQKNQAKSARESTEAAQIEARAHANAENARADAIRQANTRERIDFNQQALKACQAELKEFYSQFEYDINNLDDVESKCINIIRWIDKVDRRFKTSPAEFEIYENHYKTEKVYNDDKSKYQTLMKLLSDAVELINSSNTDKGRFAFIINKYNSYYEIEKTQQEKKQKRKNIAIKVLSLIISAVIIIVTILLVIPHPKRNDADCKAMVSKNIEKGDLQRAKKYIINYEGYKSSSFNEATNALIDAFVKCGDLEQAKATFEFLGGMAYNITLGEVFIEKGQYDEANKYWRSNDCHKACIKHMCENNQFDKAIKYVKRKSADIQNKEWRTEWVQDMNQIINSYR